MEEPRFQYPPSIVQSPDEKPKKKMLAWLFAAIIIILIAIGFIAIYYFRGSEEGTSQPIVPSPGQGNFSQQIQDKPIQYRQTQYGNCNQNNFSMAFILIGETKAQLSNARIQKLNDIKNKFSDKFYLATNGLARMDTSYPIFTLSKDELTDYSVETISKKFYETNPDSFDFISIYAVNGLGIATPTSHQSAQNKVNGIGLFLYDRTEGFGSKGRLLGVNYERDIDILSDVGSLLHETGHQWCCFVGGNFAPDNNSSLGIIQESMHFFSGLESPYRCGTPMNAGYWVSNGDGTFARSKDCLEPEKYHPFQLYFMGLYNSSNYDLNKKFNVYYSEMEMNFKALPYKQVSIQDIIDRVGTRDCDKSRQNSSQSYKTITNK